MWFLKCKKKFLFAVKINRIVLQIIVMNDTFYQIKNYKNILLVDRALDHISYDGF